MTLGNKSFYKLYVLIGCVSVLISYIINNVSVSDTIRLHNEYNDLTEKKNRIGDIHSRILELKTEKRAIETTLGYGSETATLDLLKELTDYCSNNKNITLKSIPKVAEYVEEGILLQNQSFSVEGSFSSLLKLIQRIERHGKIGKLVSVNYTVKEDLRTGKRELFALCVVRNILIQDHEI